MPWKSQISVFGNLPSGEYVTKNVSRQVILLMLLLCYHLWFQIDFACPCSSNRNIFHCYSYLVLPSLIIISLILWNDSRIGRIFRYTCFHSSNKRERGRFYFDFLLYVLQSVPAGLLWCGSVLVDGDWYVCCGAGNNEELIVLSCMKESEMGPAERDRKINLKNQSMVIGLTCILLTAVFSFIVALPWNKWCTGRNHFRTLFEEATLEQTENILWQEMDKAAADAVTKSLISLSPSTEKDPPEKKVEPTEEKEKEKILLNIDVDWEKIACLVDVLLENSANNIANNMNV